MTLDEVGEVFGFTRERARQLEALALRKIRRRVRFSSESEMRAHVGLACVMLGPVRVAASERCRRRNARPSPYEKLCAYMVADGALDLDRIARAVYGRGGPRNRRLAMDLLRQLARKV